MKLHNEEWVNILLYIVEQKRKPIVADISQTLNISYSHSFEVVKALEHNNLISTRKYGRGRTISITPVGVAVAKRLAQVKRAVKDLRS